ncbi:MAG: nucleotide pyrophosphohydrolase [Planctomycetota bacterium]
MSKQPLSDAETTVLTLRDIVETFVAERDWHRFHNPKNLSMSLAIEAGELMEHFQWLTLEQADAIGRDPDKKHAVSEELADCLAYVLSIANAMDIDLSQTLAAKMKRNAKKYPVDGDWQP